MRNWLNRYHQTRYYQRWRGRVILLSMAVSWVGSGIFIGVASIIRPEPLVTISSVLMCGLGGMLLWFLYRGRNM